MSLTIEQIWTALDQGKEVLWHHKGYMIHSVESKSNEFSKLSYRNGQALRVTCIENYFGSLMNVTDLGHAYIKESETK